MYGVNKEKYESHGNSPINKYITTVSVFKFVSTPSDGTGLGLFISKSIVDAHGGNMWAGNNPDGKGAYFTFVLPLTKN